MKNKYLLRCTLIVVVILSAGCAILKSSKIQDVQSEQGYVNKMVYCLPKGMIRIQQKATEKTTELTVQTVYVPDSEKYYLLEYLPNSGYEEKVTVSLTNEMLLKKIDITSKPKIGEIAMKVFELAREIAKLTIPIPTARGPQPKIKCFDVMIDPEVILKTKSFNFLKELTAKRKELNDLTEALSSEKAKGTAQNQEKVNELNNSIKQKENIINNLVNSVDKVLKRDGYESFANLCNQCEIEDINLTPLFTKTWSNVDSLERGIKYRPLLPYRLEIKFPNNFFVQTIYLPNEGPIITLDVTRPAFADHVTSLTFENGVLTQADLTRPSETLAFMKLPIDLVKAIAGLPLDLLQFRVQNIQQSNTYLQEQINEIKYKQMLMELKQGKSP